jgi:hypothetical protein
MTPDSQLKKEHTLREDEYHPSADSAMQWFNEFVSTEPQKWFRMKVSIFSSALSGNRLAEIMSSTIRRIDNGEPVSDRYLLGLTWFLIRNT